MNKKLKNMKVSDHTISYLTDIITGKTKDDEIAPYRTFPKLVEFFNKFGFNDVYDDVYPQYKSRKKYTKSRLLEKNNSPILEEIIIAAIDPQNFLSDGKDEKEAVKILNNSLQYNGYEIEKDSLYYKVININDFHNQNSKIQNIIFAANGEKPEIVLLNALTNQIKIVKNEENCLIYDRTIKNHGLLWSELISWWKELNPRQDIPDDIVISRELYVRLYISLQSSPPEQKLFKTYFEIFKNILNDRLPALLPQVYLHYDPYTIRQFVGEKNLIRQRMDFLLLLNGHKIVIEIDGKQHYSIDGVPSPKLYAEMVAEDRKLKLSGYEIYRFGGYELCSHQQDSAIKTLLENFFISLFKKYGVDIQEYKKSKSCN
ncbi:hypothetical protein [Spirulina sp. 06S082]|uniref:hypothetical protein n=1 Tax=Spirulina sp. 06S082 TaxID=3110248 RepID=UPI002B21B4A2|nr:hypothetical protein [Spirulina sp. 06S082]MEA5471511.1 hypothetical protein [Spirulina sp. 06S082]